MLVLQVQLFILEALMSLHMKNALKFGDPDGKWVNETQYYTHFLFNICKEDIASAAILKLLGYTNLPTFSVYVKKEID